MSDDKKWSKPCRVNAVRCPHCSQFNDLTELTWALETGDLNPQIECDQCHKLFEVVKVEAVTLVWVRPLDAATGFTNVPSQSEQSEFEKSAEYREWMRRKPRT